MALHRQGGEPAGTIFVGANHGTITRTEGLFSGGDRAVVMDEQTSESKTDAEDDDGDENVVKHHIKQAFRQASEDVKRTFNKVSRSFVDFFQDK